MANPSLLSEQQYAAYRSRLIATLEGMNVPEQRVGEIVAYADNLWKSEVPIIFDQPHLAGLLGYDLDYVQILSTCQGDFYKEYKIPKRNGKMRVINEPMPNLKEMQTWILDNILLSPGVLKQVALVATAFIPQRSIVDNASCHVGKRTVICMDLKDFFSSVHYLYVYLAFKGLGYGKDVAGMLAHLCTLNDVLPQGAPTSPMISNLILSEADKELQRYCAEMDIAYTRYADDLTFSTNRKFHYGHLIGKVKMTMEKQGLAVNNEKTKVFHLNQSQSVTGIIVNHHLQVGKNYRRRIRQEMYYLRRFGIESAYSRSGYPYSPQAYLNHLLGKVNHVLHVNSEDKEMLLYRDALKQLIN